MVYTKFFKVSVNDDLIKGLINNLTELKKPVCLKTSKYKNMNIAIKQITKKQPQPIEIF